MVCKYGFLFIAPPDLELNKTKRWQWRFFILHDDAELTYSLDENVIETLNKFRLGQNFYLTFLICSRSHCRRVESICASVMRLLNSYRAAAMAVVQSPRMVPDLPATRMP